MHILIDTTNARALARHDSHKALAALHYIQFANVDAVLLRCGENRMYAQFTADQLRRILSACGVQPEQGQDNFRGLIKLARATLEAAEWLQLPFEADALIEQAYAIETTDKRPMAFNPEGDRPLLLREWHCEPQVNRARVDSSFWIQFASGLGAGQLVAGPLTGSDPGATVRGRNNPPHHHQSSEDTMATAKKATKKATKKTTSKKAPAKKAAKKAPAKKATKKVAKAPAAPQEERNGIKRPRPGGNTAAVWDACDAVAKKKGSAPSFKEVDEHLGKASIPDATRRSNYAVWRKFNGITGRIG